MIGVGNPDRGDDGAGRAVARLLRERRYEEAEVLEADGEAATLIDAFEGAAAAWLVDASCSGAPGGTIRRFDAAAAPLPQALFALSTHGFGPAAAIELARALGQLPQRCIVYAIEGTSFGTGEPLSAPVEAAVLTVADRIGEELHQQGQGADQCTKPR